MDAMDDVHPLWFHAGLCDLGCISSTHFLDVGAIPNASHFPLLLANPLIPQLFKVQCFQGPFSALLILLIISSSIRN